MLSNDTLLYSFYKLYIFINIFFFFKNLFLYPFLTTPFINQDRYQYFIEKISLLPQGVYLMAFDLPGRSPTESHKQLSEGYHFKDVKI